ncbi:MAG: GDP-mannose 4,6-dehydratase [Planctomycetota bacterium]|nr:GDP-mannose 4,6-dehydratase [Planctomycetota bacterium]
MHYLITGGCGFIGSHLAESLLRAGQQVTLLDDLSTGKISNVRHLESNPNLRILIGSVTDPDLVHEAVGECDAVYHLASAVGVKLIMEKPVETIDTIVTGTQIVLEQANRYRKPVLLTSTSEVYGKSTSVPFEEDGDRLAGPTTKHRWAYACAKALDEFMAMAYWKSSRLPVVVVRLFNTVGPRQTGQYGMVIPNFVANALAGESLVVHGDGNQSRCFCHVEDVVRGLVGLMNCDEARGEVVNLGATEEVTIGELARRIIRWTNSSSDIHSVTYESVYGDGFEDMQRRVPSIEKANRLVGWQPEKSLEDIVAAVAEGQRQA